MKEIFGREIIELNKVVKFVNESPNTDPEYAKEGDSGFDLRAWITEEETESVDELYVTLKPLERRLIHTGLYFELPKDTEGQVRSRSGCSLKQGLIVLNSPGTIDSRFRGEVGIIAINLSNEDIKIKNGDRIAQMVICPVFCKECVNLIKQKSIDKNTERGSEKFGSTGIN